MLCGLFSIALIWVFVAKVGYLQEVIIINMILLLHYDLTSQYKKHETTLIKSRQDTTNKTN